MRSLRCTTALLVLGLLLTPGLSAIALTAHQAEGHGGDHHREDRHHVPLVEALALATVHGHHHPSDRHHTSEQHTGGQDSDQHSAAVPDHEHPAALDGGGDSRLNTLPVAVISGTESARVPDDHETDRGARHRRAPPVSLIYAHCSLLL